MQEHNLVSYFCPRFLAKLTSQMIAHYSPKMTFTPFPKSASAAVPSTAATSRPTAPRSSCTRETTPTPPSSTPGTPPPRPSRRPWTTTPPASSSPTTRAWPARAGTSSGRPGRVSSPICGITASWSEKNLQFMIGYFLPYKCHQYHERLLAAMGRD